jgi:hypothetical protein
VLLGVRSVDVAHSGALPLGAKTIPTSWPVKVRSKGNYLVGLFASKDAPDAFMIVNRDYRSGKRLWLEVKAKRIQEFDRVQGKWGAARAVPTTKAMSVELGPGDGKLFKFDSH